ncbi:MAG: maltoporin, partial [Caulobacteraceae bacterium]|nr:maltoporin [Caulobacter sp.]
MRMGWSRRAGAATTLAILAAGAAGAQPPTPADAPAVPTGVVAGAALPATQAVVSGYVAEGAAPG